MTDSAIRAYPAHRTTATRSKRARRFWRAMEAALRCTARQPGKAAEHGDRGLRGFALRGI